MRWGRSWVGQNGLVGKVRDWLHSGKYPAKVLRKRKFHRQNLLELETPKPGGFLAKRPSGLGVD
jgi:hypothetical protein